MSDYNKNLGQLGEDAAAAYLSSKGYQIIERNFKVKEGGEIDIIARKDDYLIFIEVKTRKDTSLGFPEEAVTPFKQRQIIKTVYFYLKQKHLYEIDFRVDVISIIWESKENPIINHIENAIELSN